jgi:hypothetical protein
MLGKPLMDCFMDFYADTARAAAASGRCAGSNSTAPITCCLPPTPRSARRGRASYIRETMKVIDSLDIAKADKEDLLPERADPFQTGLSHACARLYRSSRIS